MTIPALSSYTQVHVSSCGWHIGADQHLNSEDCDALIEFIDEYLDDPERV